MGKRKELVTCSECGIDYEIVRSWWLKVIKDRRPFICKDCANERQTGTTLNYNGRFCRHCGKPLYGGYYYSCPACLRALLESNPGADVDEYSVYLKRG